MQVRVLCVDALHVCMCVRACVCVRYVQSCPDFCLVYASMFLRERSTDSNRESECVCVCDVQLVCLD